MACRPRIKKKEIGIAQIIRRFVSLTEKRKVGTEIGQNHVLTAWTGDTVEFLGENVDAIFFFVCRRW